MIGHVHPLRPRLFRTCFAIMAGISCDMCNLWIFAGVTPLI
jgi:hypothetical protein